MSFQAIDRRGRAVGSGLDGVGQDTRQVAIAYVDGAVVDLSPPEGARYAAATGISRSGIISGWAEIASDVPEFAVMWSLDDPASPVVLKVPAGSLSRAVGISDDGRIAVRAETATGERSYVFDPDGTRHRLHGERGLDTIEVLGIANGWAVGSEASDSGKGHLVRWRIGTKRPEVIPIDYEFTAEINSSGVVGVRTIDGGAMYSDHRIDLPPLKGGFDVDLSTIDDDGDPAGYSGTRDFTSAAVRWSCASG